MFENFELAEITVIDELPILEMGTWRHCAWKVLRAIEGEPWPIGDKVWVW